MLPPRFNVLVVLATLAGGPVAAQELVEPPVAEVLILGTYHFDNPGLDVAQFTVADVNSPEKQAEIAAVVDALAEFRPTKVVVEWRPERAARLDSLYSTYRADRHELSQSEVEQLGFRVAARFGHDRVYPADHGGAFPSEQLMVYAQEHEPAFVTRMAEIIGQVEQELDSLQRAASVGEILKFQNRPDILRRDHGWYLATAAVGVGDGEAGANLLSAWYDRNIRIFASISALAEPGERVLVIFGSGHVPILRELVQAAPGMQLVDPSVYL